MSAERERHRQAAYLYSIIQSAENSEDGGPEGPVQEAFDAGIMYAARALLDNWAQDNDWTQDLYEYAEEIRERTVPGTPLPDLDAMVTEVLTVFRGELAEEIEVRGMPQAAVIVREYPINSGQRRA